MKLPAGDRAVVDMAKLAEYCLDPDHPRGRHRARVFQSVLGIGLSNSEVLRQALLGAATTGEAVPAEADQYGRRYAIRFELETIAGRATIVSAWIITAGEDFPRLVTCFVE